MISAFQTGEVAGSAAYHDPLILPTDGIRALALAALAERQRQGIAHCYPVEEFVRGFLAGYRNPQPGTDGLQMAVEANTRAH